MGQEQTIADLESDARYQTFWNIERALRRTHTEGTVGLRTYGTLLGAALFINDGQGPFDTMFDNEGMALCIEYHVGELLYLLDRAHPDILETRGWPSCEDIQGLTENAVIKLYNSVETFLENRRPFLQAQGFI